MSKKLWITYAWIDNVESDVDYIIQEIDALGIEVKFDRRNIIPGQRLWTQIGGFITDPLECDAWGIFLTANSVNSQPCIEELSYALERVLSIKEDTFPLFALLHGISPSQLPPSLKIRLCIPLENNNNWKEQILAAVEKRGTGFMPSGLDKWYMYEHLLLDGTFCLEIRPRFDRISPFGLAVDCEEKVNGNVLKGDFGPAGIVPKTHVAFNWIDSETNLTDGTHAWVWGADNEANSTNSYYLFYKKRPPRIWFGHQQNLIQTSFK